jgi:hypothetical protein
LAVEQQQVVLVNRLKLATKSQTTSRISHLPLKSSS